jgi:hypothetical protein
MEAGELYPRAHPRAGRALAALLKHASASGADLSLGPPTGSSSLGASARCLWLCGLSPQVLLEASGCFVHLDDDGTQRGLFAAFAARESEPRIAKNQEIRDGRRRGHRNTESGSCPAKSPSPFFSGSLSRARGGQSIVFTCVPSFLPPRAWGISMTLCCSSCPHHRGLPSVSENKRIPRKRSTCQDVDISMKPALIASQPD